MNRYAAFAYSLACYATFHVTYAYLCGFTGNLLVPKSVDAPASAILPAQALAIDFALLIAFGLQHSIMARPGFKRVWTRLVAVPVERSTYVLSSCVALGVLVWQWQPVDLVIWDVQHAATRIALWVLFTAGWLMVPVVSLMINHFDLFGLRQTWLHLRGRENTALAFKTPYLYAHIRHPIYVGWALAFCATPTMTAGHLLFAVTLTGYMALAALVEERDLVAHFGNKYETYQRTTPRYIPRLLFSRDAKVRRSGAHVAPTESNA